MMHQIVNYPGIDKADLSSITSMVYGASSVPPDIQRKVKRIIPERAQFLEGKHEY